MLIREFTPDPQGLQLAALATFLNGRAADENTSRSMSMPAFLSLARDMGVIMTADQLRDISLRPPLDAIIANVEPDRVTFRGGEEPEPTDTMSVDQARDTVDSMAKRAAKKAL